MRRTPLILAGLSALAALGLATMPAAAALKVGSAAPDFTTLGAVGGKPFKLHLAEQLRSGPVVLYFFPKAFTKGCTLEAKAFADAVPAFRAAGATVIGMSADNLDTLKRFSHETCRDTFPVASANGHIIHDYDVRMGGVLPLTNRTSYVIGRDGRIALVHSEMDWSQHVARTLAAVQAMKTGK